MERERKVVSLEQRVAFRKTRVSDFAWSLKEKVRTALRLAV